MKSGRWSKVWEGSLTRLRGGGGFIAKIRISSRVGSISAGGGKKTAGRVVETYRVGRGPYLMQRVYTNGRYLDKKSKELIVIFAKEVVAGTPEILPSAPPNNFISLPTGVIHNPKPPCFDSRLSAACLRRIGGKSVQK